MHHVTSVTIYKSKTGSTKHGHLIYSNPPSEKSYASLILLQNELLQNDADYLRDLEENGYKKRVLFSRSFLHKVKKEKGDLCCAYCNKQKLIIEEEGCLIPSRIKATIDHVVPVSKDGGIYDVTNLVVACENCNKKKSNHTLFDFLRNQKMHFSNLTKLENFKKFLSDDQINQLLEIGYKLF